MKRRGDSLSRDGETSEVLVPSEAQDSSWDSLSVRYHPVDTGWAWIIMIGVFVIHFLTTGYLRSFGLLFVEFQDYFKSSSTVTAAMSGVQMLSYSVATFTTMNFLMKYMSVRTSCLLGCVLELLSCVSNSFVTDIRYVLITHGLLFGCGQALIYCPSMVILSEYFDKRRPIATVLATGGVSAGGVFMPLLIRHLVDNYGLQGGLLLLGGVVFQQAVFVSLFTPPSYYTAADKCSSLESINGASPKKNARAEKPGPITEHIEAPVLDELKYDLNTNGNSHEKSKDIRQNEDFLREITKDTSHCDDELYPRSISVENSNVSSNRSLPINSLNTSMSHSQPSITVSAFPDEKCSSGCQNGSQFDLVPCGTTTITSSRPKSHSVDDEHAKHTQLGLNHTLAQSNSQRLLETDRDVLDKELLSPSVNSHMFIRNNDKTLVSRKSPKRSPSASLLRESSCPEPIKTGPGLLKSHRSTLHPMAFQSDTLARALSTSSIDVLGSAQRLSLAGSTMSVRYRSRPESSLDRHPNSRLGRTSRTPSPPLRLECRIPDIVKMPAFWLLALYFSCGGVASVLPTVFLPPLAKSIGLSESQSSFFLVLSAIMEMVGRLIPGLILHFGYMRPSTVVIPSMVFCGVLLQLVTFFEDFKSLVALSCLVGLFTGSFWAMQVLVVIEVIGMEVLGQAFGFYSIITGCSVGAGFPVAGAMVDATGAYILPYHFFGGLYLAAATAMVLIQFTKRIGDLDADDCVDDVVDSDDDLNERKKSARV